MQPLFSSITEIENPSITPDAAVEYLHSRDIRDAKIVNEITKWLSGGRFHVYIQADTYFEILANRTPQYWDFNGEFEPIEERLLRLLPIEDRTALQFLAFLPVWTQSMGRSVLEKFHPTYSQTQWEKLFRLSILSTRDNTHFFIPTPIRKLLIASVVAPQQTAVLQYIFQLYCQYLQDMPQEVSAESWLRGFDFAFHYGVEGKVALPVFLSWVNSCQEKLETLAPAAFLLNFYQFMGQMLHDHKDEYADLIQEYAQKIQTLKKSPAPAYKPTPKETEKIPPIVPEAEHLSYISSLLTTIRDTHSPKELIEANRQLGMIYWKSSKFTLANEYLEKAYKGSLRTFSETDWRILEIARDYAKTLGGIHKHKAAAEMLDAAILQVKAPLIEEKRVLSEARYEAACLFNLAGKHKKAAELLQKAIETQQKVGKTLLLPYMWVEMAKTMTALEMHKLAFTYFDAAITLFKQDEAQHVFNLQEAYREKGVLLVQVRLFQEAKRALTLSRHYYLQRTNEVSAELGQIYYMLGVALAALSESKNASESLEKAIAIYHKLGKEEEEYAAKAFLKSVS